MNKILVGTNVALVLAVGFLFYQVNSKPTGKDENAELVPKKNASMMPVTSKIAFFRTDSINDGYLFVKEKIKNLESQEKGMQASLESKSRALQTRYAELQQKAPTMTQAEGEAAQMEMQQSQQELEELRYKLSADLEGKRVELQKEFFGKVNSFLKKYNEKQQFDYILSYVDGGQLMLAKDTLDITRDVLTGLNAEYTNSKKTK